MSGAFTPATRRLIIARDEGACVCCGQYCIDPDTGVQYAEYSLQHRRARGMGGSSDPVTASASNGIVLCGSATSGDHGRAESNPGWAADRGYRIPQGADPRAVPIFHVNRGLTFLHEDGTYGLEMAS